jgi:2,3-bisphosphoglycerate-independent phosphoglycerate mutase
LPGKKENVRKVVCTFFWWTLFPETSALDYVEPFETFLSELRSSEFDVCIASGGGRMQITMDRYNANWKMVEIGWKTHVLGEGRLFESAKQAIETFRGEAKVIDQDLPPFVIAKRFAVGAIRMAIGGFFISVAIAPFEITRSFEEDNFTNMMGARPRVTYAVSFRTMGISSFERFLERSAIENTSANGSVPRVSNSLPAPKNKSMVM